MVEMNVFRFIDEGPIELPLVPLCVVVPRRLPRGGHQFLGAVLRNSEN
jgi:hypothetical protein